MLACLLALAPLTRAGWECPWPSADGPASDGEVVAERFPAPEGFVRLEAPAGSFAGWLRRLPLRPAGSQVHLFDGRRKANQSAHLAVLDLDVGRRDLQQCADAVMRLRAEYLWSAGCRERIAFDFTSGDPARWVDWRDGRRAHVDGARVRWSRDASPDASYASFRRYLEVVFSYAGTASLARELGAVARPSRVEPGDVFIHPGHPGHAVLVLDVAEARNGERRMLLAQSYMPAQEMHVLRVPGTGQAWYAARDEGALRTPEWVFDHRDLRRFDAVDCRPGG